MDTGLQDRNMTVDTGLQNRNMTVDTKHKHDCGHCSLQDKRQWSIRQ